MASGTKYFLLNHQNDWSDNSVIENIYFEDDTLKFKNTSGEKGVYISSAFDSLKFETVWNRLRFDVNLSQDILFKVKIYSSDRLTVSLIDEKTGKYVEKNLNDLLMDQNTDSNKKLEILDYIGAKSYDNPTDIVMHTFKGRYIWIAIEIFCYNDEVFSMNKMKLEFPRISFINYLPQVYSKGQEKDSFLSRFLAVFQSIYYDLEDDIDSIPKMFAPNIANKEALEWLTSWFSVEDSYIWGEDRLRKLLENIMEIYRMKGTSYSISKMIELYIGIKPIIIEQFKVVDNDHYNECKENIERLYGESSYTFSVLINTDKEIGSDIYAELLKIIESCKPLDSICNLVILNNKIYLDHHCYLGVNSYITQNENIVLG